MKTVVITGATSGIGLLTALKFSRLNYRVIGIGRSEENINKANAFITGQNEGAALKWFQADLLQQREVNRVAAELSEYLESECAGRLDVLINNAGCVRSWYMTTEDGYEHQLALNYLVKNPQL